MATKKVATKITAPKPAKVAKPAKKLKAVKLPESGTASWTAPVTLVSFSVTAVIPTQQYGNIQPKIEVTASSIEEARAVVMPIIEDLYRTYAETPLNGRELKFLGKVTETVKTVAPASQVLPGAVLNASQSTAAATNYPTPVVQATPSNSNMTETNSPGTVNLAAQPKSEAVLKAEKAISLAMSTDAALAIQDQIEKSVKIAPEDKPALINLVLVKRNQYK